ncbi:putative zinc metalloprotease [compost metagenome]
MVPDGYWGFMTRILGWMASHRKETALATILLSSIAAGLFYWQALLLHLGLIDLGAMATAVGAFSVMILVVVGFHEFGHYLVGRMVGLKVLEFSVGFGYPLVKYQSKRSGIQYKLGIAPVGGYVKFLDDRAADDVGDSKGLSLKEAGNLQKAAMVLAGPLFNAILAFIVFFAIAVIGTPQYRPLLGDTLPGGWAEQQGFLPGDLLQKIDGSEVRNLPDMIQSLLSHAGEKDLPVLVQNGKVSRIVHANLSDISLNRENIDFDRLLGISLPHKTITSTIASVKKGGLADVALMTPGDRILSINDQVATTERKVLQYLDGFNGKTVKIDYQRADELKSAYVVSQADIGAEFSPYSLDLYRDDSVEDTSLTEKMAFAAERVQLHTITLIMNIKGMMTTHISTEMVSGPVGLAKAAGDFASHGLVPYLNLVALLSIGVMVMNLLPIPALDGFHLVIFTAQGLMRRQFSDKAIERMMMVGVSLLAFIMLYAFFVDFKYVVMGGLKWLE